MSNVKTLTRTSLLIAVIIVTQQIRIQYVTGSLINATLALSVKVIGLPGAALLSILSPALAMAHGLMPVVVLYPFIAAGNLLFCLIFYLFRRKSILAVVLGSLLKPAIIAIGFHFAAGIPWPGVYPLWLAQVTTALVGGAAFAAIHRFTAEKLNLI